MCNFKHVEIKIIIGEYSTPNRSNSYHLLTNAQGVNTFIELGSGDVEEAERLRDARLNGEVVSRQDEEELFKEWLGETT